MGFVKLPARGVLKSPSSSIAPLSGSLALPCLFDQGPSRVVTVQVVSTRPASQGFPRLAQRPHLHCLLPDKDPFPFPLPVCLSVCFFALPLSLFPTPVVMSSARAQGQGDPESNSCPSWGCGGQGERQFFSLSPGFLSCKMGEELEI